MDLTEVVSLISNVGFPIACCIYLIYSQQKTEASHKEEIDKLRETVDNNTKVMVKICTRLGVDVD